MDKYEKIGIAANDFLNKHARILLRVIADSHVSNTTTEAVYKKLCWFALVTDSLAEDPKNEMENLKVLEGHLQNGTEAIGSLIYGEAQKQPSNFSRSEKQRLLAMQADVIGIMKELGFRRGPAK